MEELQDAIEDAQYLTAMHDDMPKPMLPWPKYKDEEIAAFVLKQRTENPPSVELEGMCSGSLGFYMFTQFVIERGEARAKAQAKFLTDVALYRLAAFPPDQSLASTAVKIIETYLVASELPPEPTEVDFSPTRPSSLLRKLKSTAARAQSLAYAPAPAPAAASSSTVADAPSSPTSSGETPAADSASQAVSSPSAAAAVAAAAAAIAAAAATGTLDESKATPKWQDTIVDVPSLSPQALSRKSSWTAKGSFSASTAVPVMPNAKPGGSGGGGGGGGGGEGATGSGSGSGGDQQFTSLIGVNALGMRKDCAAAVSLVAQLEALKKTASLTCGAASPISSPTRDSRRETGSRAGTGTSSGAEAATVVAEAQPDKGIFDDLDELVFDCLRDTFFEAFQASKLWKKYFSFIITSQRPIVESDFALFRVLGRGGFGLVNGCKRSMSGKLYAMKMMNKLRVKLKKAEAFCVNERNILAAVNSPFLVCLKYAFSTPKELYLILDLMMGGDLGYHLQRKGKFSDTETVYYAARILAGIAALHELNIVYRDLKPENVLMDENGSTKISDLGLACKMGKSGLTGACGTRGYWAPEMLRKDAAGKRERYFLQVDWFSFGVCVYEFMYGIGPFRTEMARKWGDFPKLEKADKDKAIDLAILEMEPQFDPIFFDETAKSLIQGLLHKDPTKRLGARGPREIMRHPFFAKINWETLAYATPPSIPPKDINMATQSEIGSFTDDRQSGKLSLDKTDQKRYENWEFLSVAAFQEEVVELLQYEAIHGEIKAQGGGGDCCTIL